MRKRWVVTALAWLALLAAFGVALAITHWLVAATFWGIAAHYAVATLLNIDGDPPGRRVALVAIVAVVGGGVLAVTTARWGDHEWPAYTFSLFFGWLAHEIGGRLLAPRLIHARMDRLRGNMGTERYASADASDVLSRRVPSPDPPPTVE